MLRFTEEELALAKQVDLCRVAERLGYTVKRIGQYHTLKEMDSIRIYHRSHWCRFSRRYDKGENGGSQIDTGGRKARGAFGTLPRIEGKRNAQSLSYCRSLRAATLICTVIWSMNAGLHGRSLTFL